MTRQLSIPNNEIAAAQFDKVYRKHKPNGIYIYFTNKCNY
jgi:hypothetical protein